MLIDLEKLPVDIVPHMQDGEKEVHLKKWSDGPVKVLQGKLPAGASIGLHTHETNCEVIYILSGTGKALCDDTEELLGPSSCHYCPMGHRHSLINCGSEDLVFFAVVPEHRL